jgi:hypothetical protein
MKTFLLLAFSLITALTQVARAEDENPPVKPVSKHVQAPPRHVSVPQGPRVRQNATVNQQGPVYRTPRVNTANTNQTYRVRPHVNQDAVRANRWNNNQQYTPRVRTNPNVVTTTPQTTAIAQANVNARNWRNSNRTSANWQARTSPNFDRDDARRRHDRHHHDRGWWRSRYNRFALFGGGYYFWDNYYWYPAYGYDPAYNSYSYDEPIYGAEDQDPGQVISSVQTELQRLGYYRYAVDGLMGPATRAAIARYQRDNGLAMTSAIDQPTLQSLGLQ